MNARQTFHQGDRGYLVLLADRAGEYMSQNVNSFDEALEVARELAAQYPEKYLRAYNLEQLDLDCDGLTDDERDAIDSVSVPVRTCPRCGTLDIHPDNNVCDRCYAAYMDTRPGTARSRSYLGPLGTELLEACCELVEDGQ